METQFMDTLVGRYSITLNNLEEKTLLFGLMKFDEVLHIYVFWTEDLFLLSSLRLDRVSFTCSVGNPIICVLDRHGWTVDSIEKYQWFACRCEDLFCHILWVSNFNMCNMCL